MCKTTRKRLKEATKIQFNKWIDEAALTPSQKETLTLHILSDLSIAHVSLRLHISERAVTNKLAMAYKKISKVIKTK